jgi:hypothetical protein
LKTLTQNEEAGLFGRAEVIDEVIANSRAERLTVITSEPGLGVTSLLQAGIAPALRKAGFVVVFFSEWQGRFFATNLREAVASAIRESLDPSFYAESEELDSLLERIRRRTGARVALVFDQFEDYIRCHQNSELSDGFDAEVAHAVAARKSVFVIGLQAHAIPAFDRLNQHIANLRGFEIKLKPLTEQCAREVVLAEADRVGLHVEPAALDAIVSSPAVRTDDGGVHPFFLRIAISVLEDAEARRKSMTLTAANIEAFGGVDRAVLEFLDADLGDLPTTHQELLFRWCNVLISAERHRLAVTEKGLTDYAGKLNRWVPPLLNRLMELNIMRGVDTAGVVRYEIARDCYTPMLRDWWERREAAIIARRRAQFRVRSLWVAGGAILMVYIVWLIFSK